MCFENVPCKAFIVEKTGLGIAPIRCGIHSKPQRLLQKNCLFHAFKTLVAYARLCLLTQVDAHVCGPRATSVFYFSKYIFSYLKGYIFYFNTPYVNLIFNWALNRPWTLKFGHLWGMGARVVRGTKCSVYSCDKRNPK